MSGLDDALDEDTDAYTSGALRPLNVPRYSPLSMGQDDGDTTPGGYADSPSSVGIPGAYQNLLDKYTNQYGTLETQRTAAEQAAAEAAKQKKAALQRGYDNLAARKPDNTELLLSLASGLLSPTKTGSFFESLGNAGAAAVPAVSRRTALNEALRKEKLGYDVGMADVDAGTAAASTASLDRRMQLAQSGVSNVLTQINRRDLAMQAAEQRAEMNRLRMQLERDKIDSANRRSDAASAARYSALSPEAKRAADRVGGIAKVGTPEYQQALDEELGINLETPAEHAKKLDALGVPDMPTNPYAGMSRPSQIKARETMLKTGNAELEKESDAVHKALNSKSDMTRFMQLTRDLPTTPLAGNLLPLFSAKAEEANSILSKNIPSMRDGLPGAASDRDVSMFASALPKMTNYREANEGIVRGLQAASDNIVERQRYRTQYLAAHGTLQGADAAWSRYLKDNPIFDPRSEDPVLNTKRTDWETYFRNERKFANFSTK